MNPPIIVPTSLLGQGLDTNTHLCYTSIALVDKEYREYYRQKSLLKEPVILDHSPNVPRKGLTWPVIREVLGFIQPRAVVLPDFDYDREKTLSLSLKVLNLLKGGGYKGACIGPIQGYNTEDLYDCYSSLVDGVDVIGLPCGLEKIQSRNSIVRDFGIKKPVVFIETYSDFIKEKPTHSNVDLYWSSFPYRLGMVGRDLSYTYRPPPDMCWDGTEMNPSILRNLEDYVKETVA